MKYGKNQEKPNPGRIHRDLIEVPLDYSFINYFILFNNWNSAVPIECPVKKYSEGCFANIFKQKCNVDLVLRVINKKYKVSSWPDGVMSGFFLMVDEKTNFLLKNDALN